MPSWWTDERIERTVKAGYIENELGSKRHQESLHRVLAFGDGLTDDTYCDWILERSPRFFLILNDIGVPEKIFDIIDRSFDDDDLPLTQDALWELNLFGTSSETLDKKFFRQQFYYLIRQLEAGGHVDYGHWEVAPLEVVSKKPGISAAAAVTDRITTQNHSYTRKRIPTNTESGIDRIRFIMHLKNISAIQHQHLVTVWATYYQNNFNYVLLDPCTDVTLKQMLDEKEQGRDFKALEKHDRRQILLSWIQCLNSALAYLHSKGFCHKTINLSAIKVDQKNVIYLSDYDALKVLDWEESPKAYSSEIYDHAPPENWLRRPTLHETAPLKTVLPGGGRTSRRLSTKNTPSSDFSRRASATSMSEEQGGAVSGSNSSSGSSVGLRPRNALITTFAPPENPLMIRPAKYFAADVFSMTTVNITILSYLLGHSPKTFASYRSRINRQAGRGNAPPDSSFHKNLCQVEKWIESLIKQAGQKEKKDLKLWGAVSEIAKLCKSGIQKEPSARISAAKLEKKVLSWVDYGLGRQRRCSCSEVERRVKKPEVQNSIIAAQRSSTLSWSKISERLQEDLQDDPSLTPMASTLRPRRSISLRLSLDRAPELRRSLLTRPEADISGRISPFDQPLIEEPVSPSRPDLPRRRSSTAQIILGIEQTPQVHRPSSSTSNRPTIVHQGRSSYKLKPKKQTLPDSAMKSKLNRSNLIRSHSSNLSIPENDPYVLSRNHSGHNYPVIHGIPVSPLSPTIKSPTSSAKARYFEAMRADASNKITFATESEIWGRGAVTKESESIHDVEIAPDKKDLRSNDRKSKSNTIDDIFDEWRQRERSVNDTDDDDDDDDEHYGNNDIDTDYESDVRGSSSMLNPWREESEFIQKANWPLPARPLVTGHV